MYVFCLLDFSYYYWTLPLAFVFDGCLCRLRYFWSWSVALVLACLSAFYFVFWNPLLVFLVFLCFFLCFCVLSFGFISCLSFRPLARFAPLVFPFFSLHCWFLGSFWCYLDSWRFLFTSFSFCLLLFCLLSVLGFCGALFLCFQKEILDFSVR